MSAVEKKLNAAKAAEVLGVSQPTVVKLYKEGAFPNAYRLGKKYFIPLKDLEAAKQKPSDEFKKREATA